MELGRVSTDVINNPLQLELSSPILLPSQQLTLATTTEGSPAEGPTNLEWTLTCDGEPLGTIRASDDGACDCVCDVDGEFRHSSGELCEAPSVE